MAGEIVRALEDSIYKLLNLGVQRKNIVIACSPLLKRLIERDVYDVYRTDPHLKIKTFEGVDIYEYHPYNEIVVYEKNMACYREEFMVKFSLGNYPECLEANP